MKALLRPVTARSIQAILFAAFLGAAGSATAQQQAVSSLRGSWSATVGARPALQGTWSAELHSTSPNSATGAWALVGAGGRIAARGTWSATRTAGIWSGAWSARASTGAPRSGTWRAEVARGPATFTDLLRSTIEQQLNGSWRSAGLQGRWALRADASGSSLVVARSGTTAVAAMCRSSARARSGTPSPPA
jgi:hypothetical protein